jgi:hypothetical protein
MPIDQQMLDEEIRRIRHSYGDPKAPEQKKVHEEKPLPDKRLGFDSNKNPLGAISYPHGALPKATK